MSSSISAFTMPEASVAAEWQWIQPCVWTMFDERVADAAHREPRGGQIRDERVEVRAASVSRNSMLCRLVKRRYPSQCVSARSQI